MAFTLMAFGSWLAGARVLVALIRGIEGFAVFGAIAWCAGKWLQGRNGQAAPESNQDDGSKGAHLNETV